VTAGVVTVGSGGRPGTSGRLGVVTLGASTWTEGTLGTCGTLLDGSGSGTSASTLCSGGGTALVSGFVVAGAAGTTPPAARGDKTFACRCASVPALAGGSSLLASSGAGAAAAGEACGSCAGCGAAAGCGAGAGALETGTVLVAAAYVVPAVRGRSPGRAPTTTRGR